MKKQTILAIAALAVLASCGVKGPPRPPDRPTELGRGQPTFKRATEEFAFPNVPSPDAPTEPSKKPTATEGK